MRNAFFVIPSGRGTRFLMRHGKQVKFVHYQLSCLIEKFQERFQGNKGTIKNVL